MVAGAGIGQVVGRHVNRLHRRHRALLRRGNALLQLAHFRGEVGLVSHGGRHAAQQRGYFRARLGEAENIVDEQQRVRTFFVAEVFGDGQRGQGHAQTRSGRLGHLAIDQRGLRLRWLLDIDHARLLHFQPQIVAFTGALAHAGKHGEAAVLQRDVVDEFHDDDGLAHAGAAEQADLAALQERLDQVDNLHAGLEHLHLGGLLVECRRLAMDGIALGGVDRAQLVDRIADDVEHAAQGLAAHGHGDGAAQVDGLHAAHHALGGLHGNAAHPAFAQLLLHFQDDVDGRGDGEALAGDAQRRVDRRQRRLGKLHVDRGTRDLNDVSDILSHNQLSVVSCRLSVAGKTAPMGVTSGSRLIH